MEWVVGIILVVIIVWASGRAKGPPDPATQTDAWLQLRLQTEGAWINKYLRLPLENQRSESLKRMYDEKTQYIKTIETELLSRQIARGMGAASNEMQPILDKASELQKSGMSQPEALKAALEEWKNRVKG